MVLHPVSCLREKNFCVETDHTHCLGTITAKVSESTKWGRPQQHAQNPGADVTAPGMAVIGNPRSQVQKPPHQCAGSKGGSFSLSHVIPFNLSQDPGLSQRFFSWPTDHFGTLLEESMGVNL